MAAISTIILTARVDDSVLSTAVGEITDGRKFFSFLILYSPLIPIAIYGTLDMIILFQRKNLQNAFAPKSTGTTKSEIKVLDPNTFPNLGQVSYCFLDKTGTLTTGDFRVKAIISNGKNYAIDTNEIQSMTQRGSSSLVFGNFIEIKPQKVPVEETERKEEEPQPSVKNPPTNHNSMFHKEDIDKLLLNGADVEVEVEQQRSSQDFSLDMDIVVNNEGGHLSVRSPGKMECKFKDEIELRMKKSEFLSSYAGTDINSPLNRDSILKGGGGGRSLVFQDKNVPNPLNLETSEPKKDSRANPSGNVFTELGQTGQTMRELKNELAQKEADTQEFVKDLFNEDINDGELNELGKCLALCHSSRTRYQNDGYTYESVNPEDNAILKFAKHIGFAFEMSNRPDNPSIYTVRRMKERKNYNILGVNDFSYGRRRLSICFREPSDTFEGTATLFVRGNDQSMRERLVLDEQEMDLFNKNIAKNTALGYRTIVFAKRELTSAEANEFYKKYQNLKSSLYNQEEGLEQIANEYENKLKLIGIVALQDQTAPAVPEALMALRDAGINCWMLTGDTMEQAISSGYTFEFLKADQEIYTINATRREEARVQIRNILTNIKRKIDQNQGKTEVNVGRKRGGSPSPTSSNKSMSLFKTQLGGKNKSILSATVVISGEAWQIIANDKYLLCNFAFICAVSGTVIGYSLTPKNKKDIVKMVKRYFPGRPITLGIGDGMNDAMMLQTADVSIEVAKEDNESLTPCNAGDIRVKSLQVIKDILLVYGRNYSAKIEISIVYMFFKSYLLGLPLFFFSWYCSFTGTPVIPSLLVLFYAFLFTFFPIIVFAASTPVDSPLVLRHFPALYMDGKLQKQRIFKIFIFKSVLESIIHAAIIFYTTAYTVESSLDSKGRDSSMDMITMLIFYLTTLIANLVVTKTKYNFRFQTNVHSFSIISVGRQSLPQCWWL